MESLSDCILCISLVNQDLNLVFAVVYVALQLVNDRFCIYVQVKFQLQIVEEVSLDFGSLGGGFVAEQY
ncbi:MAG: hypothetical protein NC548_52430, partial [Lachnospiraceae bacterium]|nr:hypothetical protein [Lachnospiraceae bacterium]